MVTPSPRLAKSLAAAARLECEADHRSAFEHTPAPMYFASPDDAITVANDAFARLVGRPRLELIGLHSSAFTHPDDLEIAARANSRLVADERDVVRFSIRIVHTGGRLIEVDVSKSAVRATDGHIRRFIVSDLDSTERRRHERSAALLSQVRRLAIVATSEAELRTTFCNVLVDVGGYRLVTYASATETSVVAPTTAADQWTRPDDGPGAESIATDAAVLYGTSGRTSSSWR